MSRRYDYAFWIKDESHKHLEIHCFGYNLGIPGKDAEWTTENNAELDRSEAKFIDQLKKAGNIITFGLDADQPKDKWFPKLGKGQMLDALILRTIYPPDDSESRLSMYRVQVMSLSTTSEHKAGYVKAFVELQCKVHGSVWKED